MKKFFLLSAAVVAASAMFAQDDALEMYVIGSDVNGAYWTEGDPGGKMTLVGDGIYVWTGNLGTGFKFNDGTWSGSYNLGSNKKIAVGQTITLDNDGGSGNINFEGFTMLKNAHLSLDINTLALTIVGGDMEGEIQWFLVGDFNDWAITAEAAGAIVFDKTSESGVFVKNGIDFAQFGGDITMKISNTGWGEQYGDNDGTIEWGVNTEIGDGINAAYLHECGSEGTMRCFLFGNYNASLDLNTMTDGVKTPYLMFVDADSQSVNSIEAANGEAVYFNLQGVQINEPAGLCIKMLNGKTSKVVVR